MQRIYLIVLGVLILLSACRKEKFKSESTWILPLLEAELSLSDILADSFLSEDADGAISVVFENEYGISNLEDILVIPDRVESIEVSLTNLELEDRSFTDTLTLLELYPASLFLNGQTTNLDEQDITTNEGTVLDVTEEFFTTATFKEGYIDISISNDLPVDAEVLEFELRNEADKKVIVSGEFYNLLSGATVQDSYNLAGQTVDGVMELIVKRVKTKASNGAVLIDVTQGIRTTITVRGLKPEEATAIFPAQNLIERDEETQYTFGGAQLTQVYVKSGSILMKVESSIEEAIILDYKIPNSFKENEPGSIQQQWTIPPAPKGSVVYVEERFPIDGFVIYLWGKSKNTEPNYNLIYNELVARIAYSGIERSLALTDKIKIEFGLIDVKPALIIGDPGRHNFTLTDTLNLNAFSNFSGKLNLEDARVDLNFFNSFGIESYINVSSIRGINAQSGRAVNLTTNSLKNIRLDKATNPPWTPVEKDIILHKSNSNIKQFLENIPHKIVPEIRANINPNGTVDLNDFAFEKSKLTLNFRLIAPLYFGLDSLTLHLNRNLNTEENQLEKVKEGEIVLVAKNDFPIEAGLILKFKNTQGITLFSKTIEDNQKMAAAEIDPITGKTLTPAESEIVIALNQNEMNLLRMSESVDVNVIFSTEDAKRFKMFNDYTIYLKLGANFIYENNF